MSETNTPAPSPYEHPATDGKPDIPALLAKVRDSKIEVINRAYEAVKRYPVAGHLDRIVDLFTQALDALEALAHRVEKLERENAELTRKGESLCEQNGTLLVRGHDQVSDLAAAREQCEELRKGLLAVQDLIDNSSGVDGLHRNGESVPWDDLLAGGAFGAWLSDFSAAITKARAGEKENAG